MDDVMMILGALIVSAGVAWLFMPLGLIVFGSFMVVGGWMLAGRSKPPA
jgi:uncharacterized protein (DUF2062 family)